jgi:hypothetical protein
MICRVFTGIGSTLEKATQEAEQQANEELKKLPNSEAVALSTNHHQDTSGLHFGSSHTFVITVLYQKKERR